MDNCIAVQDLIKQFHKNTVVDSINFTVGKGQICAFLGPNGAGKSTTMKMLATLLNKTNGKIMIEGLDMDIQSGEIKRKLGVVFQEDVLDGSLTVEENLYYRGGLYIKSNKELYHKIDQVVTLLELQKLRNKKYETCSGGQKRIVQIGRALLTNPKLLLLDEPTIGLDPLARTLVWKVLRKLNREQQITIFFTTHYMEETDYANHICIIHEGKILLCQNRDRLLRNPWRDNKRFTIHEIYLDLLARIEEYD
ncbi:ABC transporter ATP-binding protein [Lachnoclostridium phytofermentans]|uniref:ABC transporter related n=1 Tax=Lachnoclostridium phytofermentans (strain ATCC 700394 / DSM 18823 / ISDg) TaxID=357809 RepID=A9KIH8_LACP7|nr:ABC transporter ATP-binding protein [Lachnoclostridium phytofermentans]ABX42430.1 ABC transporter related [Lachnoclostridium phytofermentans ISDg]